MQSSKKQQVKKRGRSRKGKKRRTLQRKLKADLSKTFLLNKVAKILFSGGKKRQNEKYKMSVKATRLCLFLSNSSYPEVWERKRTGGGRDDDDEEFGRRNRM